MTRRHKRFIDKRHSETYQLIYRSTDDQDFVSEQRVLVESEQIRGPVISQSKVTDAAGSRRVPFPSYLFQSEELTEEQIQEIRDLGLPLDGYNYLQHLRTLGHGRTELPIVERPGSVFVKSEQFIAPEPDTRMVHAKALTVRSEAMNEEEAEGNMKASATQAFSSIIPSAKGTAAAEIRDVDETIDRFEGMCAEDGDLLDSFVLDATRPEDPSMMQQTDICHGKQWIAFPEDLSTEDEVWEEFEQSEVGDGKTKSIGRSRFSRAEFDTSSSFSDRWKGVHPTDFEGRRERTRPLEIIDEKFENILEEYDEDELGELDDEIEGGISLDQLTKCLTRHESAENNGFQPENNAQERSTRPKKKKPPKRIGPYKLLKQESRAVALKEKDAKAIDTTKTLAHSLKIGSKREEWEDVIISVRAEKALDCESAWSMKTHSTLYQPTQIVSIKTKERITDVDTKPVRLSSKSGLPLETANETIKKIENAETSVENEEYDSIASHERNRKESPEEKRQRKQAVKDAQRQARIKKKETKTLYRQEIARQQKHIAGMMTKNASVVEL